MGMIERRGACEDHHRMLREHGCIVTGRAQPTLHHCHGGSMRQFGSLRGMGQRTSDWLVIPIHADIHCVGGYAMDGSYGVRQWEATFGTQVYWLQQVCMTFGVDVFCMAGLGPRPSRVDKFGIE